MKKLLPALCLILSVACAPTMQSPPTFSITTQNPDDRITFAFQDDTGYFGVSSPGGVGKAQILLNQGALPRRIAFRLYLKGLENFVFTFDQQRIEVSVPTGSPSNIIEASKHNSSTEYVPLGPSNPLWMPLKIVASSEVITLPDGHIEIDTPRAVLETGVREFEIEWIDFYR
jgi:hypothetical protein